MFTGKIFSFFVVDFCKFGTLGIFYFIFLTNLTNHCSEVDEIWCAFVCIFMGNDTAQFTLMSIIFGKLQSPCGKSKTI